MSGFRPYTPPRLSLTETRQRMQAFYEHLDQRRSVRFFSDDPVPRDVIADAIRAASTAPSGAHRQPWQFVAVSDPTTKHRIRIAAEAEERRSYEGRMSEEWLSALRPLGTGWQKPYLEKAPWLVVVFAEQHSHHPDGQRRTNYYVRESVGIACGLFIAALHQAGLATLTHTPSPMKFLKDILDRPSNEQPYILFPIGYPTPDAVVPDIKRKSLEEVSVWVTGEE
ncbi:MAG: iodotyrosine deiodinase [Myxococcota bacterium]|jgi:iodotyrosine deiodinase